MENHHFDQIILSMNISCCERCPKILKTKLLNMHDVDSVSIDTENDVVVVTGTVDPMSLLNKVAKLGKKVRLLPNNDEPSNERRHVHTPPRVEEEPHRCEPYEPPLVDERFCRDFFCKIHPRTRTIVDRVSGKGSFFEGWPFYGYGPHMHPMYGMPPPHFGGYHRPPPLYECHRPRPFSNFDVFW